jgi:hypothetical protein
LTSAYQLGKSQGARLYTKLRARLLHAREDSPAEPSFVHRPGYNHALEEAYQRCMAQGSKVLFMMAALDPNTADFEEQFIPSVLKAHQAYRLVKIEGTTHTFAELGKEERLFEEIKGWLGSLL